MPEEPSAGATGPAPLTEEARIFSRYLVGRVAGAALLERYRAAVEALLPEPAEPRDEALVAFARRHPWSVSWLDAACGLLRPKARLREKILVMAAVLEASPEFADEFLPRSVGRGALLLRLAGLGALAVARALGGLLLLPFAARP